MQLGSFFGPDHLVQLLRHRASHQADQRAFTFLVDGETEEIHLTNAELDRQARAIAASLQAQRLEGERALLLYPAGLDFIAAFFGCLYAGVIAVTAYPPRMNRSLDRIQAIVADSDAKIALTTDSVLERVRPMLDATNDLSRIGWLTTDTIAAGREDDWREPNVSADTLAFLQYTSGSTGTPKGVMLSHGNLLHNSALIAEGFEHTRTCSGVFWLPSYHDMGLVGGILQPLYLGRPNVLMSPMSFLQKPIRWLRAISRYRGTTSGGPNFAYDLCVSKISPEQCEGLDLSSWKVAFNGAEPIREETLDRFAEKFAPYGFRREAFYPCYGLAEATLIVSGGYTAHAPVRKSFDAEALENRLAVEVADGAPASRTLVSSGRALPDERIAIVQPETRSECLEGQIGEIWVGGPSVAQGYWRRPNETEHTFQARIAGTGEGPFLRTGDLGFLADGELFVTGRIKDLIIVRGVNHYPQDLELTAEKSHPALRSNAGAAFSVEIGGTQRLVLVHEIERGQFDEAPAALEAIRRDVSREHELQVDAIVLIKPGSIPKTSSGKIQRHAARDAFLADELKTVAQWNADGDSSAVAATTHRAGSRRRSRTVEVAASNGHATASAHAGNGTAGGNGVHNGNGAGRNGKHHATNGSHHSGNGKHLHTNGQQRDKHGARHETSGKNGAASAHAAGTNGSANGSSNGESRPATRDEVAWQLFELIGRVSPQYLDRLTLDTSLADLGMDSLQRIELQASIEEHFGGRFPEHIGPDLETVAEIVTAIEQYLGRPESSGAPAAPVKEIPTEHYQIEAWPEYEALREKLDLLEASGLGNPFFNEHECVTRDTTVVDGRRMINFSSYNYLGMSGDPVVTAATKEAIDRYGTSVSASRLVSGEKTLHRQLEQALADMLGAEAALAFVGGHATNETVVGHLFGRGDLVLHDALAHNSIVQGCILSGAARRPFPHNDWRALDRLLTDLRHQYRRVLIAIEGVYSMDGDIADLPRFVEIRNRHKAVLMVDEAHSAGVLGPHGRGIGEHFGVRPQDVDIWMGTLSKSFGSCGGYIAGTKALVEYLKYTAPGFVFSVGLSPPNAAASLAAIRLLESEPHRVAQLQERSALFLELARQRGLNTGMSRGSAVVPVIIGNSMVSLQLSRALFERGINVHPILYPAVEESAARLRFFISCCHTEEQIRFTVDAVAEELGRIDATYIDPKRARTNGHAPVRHVQPS